MKGSLPGEAAALRRRGLPLGAFGPVALLPLALPPFTDFAVRVVGAAILPAAMRSDPAPPAVRIAARLREGRSALFIASAALLGVALTLAREISYGPGFGPDQSIYVEAARNLLRGEAFVQLDGRPYTFWAPLYPALLAGASLSVFDPLDVAGPLNAAVHGLIIFVAGKWIWRRLESRFLAAWSALAIALSLPLAHAASIAFPIVLLTLFTMLALINADMFFREKRRSALALAALFSALAWLTHYMGVAVAVSIAALLAVHPQARLLDKAKRVAAYGLASSAPIGVWALWILYRTGEFTANRRPVDYYLPGLARDVIAEMSEWAFVNLYVGNLHSDPDVERWPIASALTGAAVAALFGGVCYGMARALFIRGDRGRAIWDRCGALFVFGGFALAHVFLYLVALAAGSTWNGVQPRHLLPMHLPLFIAAVLAADEFLLRRRGGRRLFALGERAPSISIAGAAAAALALWLALTIALQPVAIRNANVYGITGQDIGVYSAPRWVNSETIARMIENPPAGVVYSNQTEALSLYAPAEAPPRPLPNATLLEWVALAPDGAALAWFHEVGGGLSYDAADLRAAPGLEMAAELSDGVLFRVNKAHNPRPARRAAYAALAAGEPAARSVYDVFLDGRTLAYVKSPCSREETAPRFFLHVVPANLDDLPDDRERWGFDNRDFLFERGGVRIDGACLTGVSLPPYPIAEIETGQFAGGARLWETKILFGERPSPAR